MTHDVNGIAPSTSISASSILNVCYGCAFSASIKEYSTKCCAKLVGRTSSGGRPRSRFFTVADVSEEFSPSSLRRKKRGIAGNAPGARVEEGGSKPA